MSEEQEIEEEITVITVLKLSLFLVWWFSGIGVGTAFMAPGIVGTVISPSVIVAIILAFFCSALLIVTLVPGPDDKLPESAELRSEPEASGATTP